MAFVIPSNPKARINPVNELTLGYKNLANAIIRHAHFIALHETGAQKQIDEPVAPHSGRDGDKVDTIRFEQLAPVPQGDRFELGYVKIGPFEVRPGLGQEVPIGRSYQPLPNNSISRLAGYLGRDEYGLYIREVPEIAEVGLKPSKFGVWVKQPEDADFRRLQPGQAERIYSHTDVRIGGNGCQGETGFKILVH